MTIDAILRQAPIRFADISLELVLARLVGEIQPYVVWVHNPRTGDFAWGHYYATLADAEKGFAQRLAAYTA